MAIAALASCQWLAGADGLLTRLGLPFRIEGGSIDGFFDFSTQVENALGLNGPEGIDSEVKQLGQPPGKHSFE